MDMNEIKSLIEGQGKAFEEFKAANDARLKEVEKKGAADVLIEEKVGKLGDALDKMIEAKSAIEKRIEAEKKEREELELRLSRPGASKGEGEAAEKELKSFNAVLAAANAERNQAFQPLDGKGLDAYRGYFGTYLRKGDKALYGDEVKTMSVGVDPDGGYWVTPDVSGRIATKVFETSEIRSIASVQTIGTDALEGIEDTGEAGAGYAGEASTSGDTTTPQIGKWRIPVYWIDTEPKTTQQLLDDANVNVEQWLANKAAERFGRFENAEFCTGATKIRGFAGGYATAADTGSVPWGTIGFIASGAAGDFAATTPSDKLFDLIGTVKNAYLNGARFVTRRSVITKIRKFKDGNNLYLWQPSLQVGQPEMLLGFPVTRAEDMPALAADSFSLAFGNFAAGYQIVDRAGVTVLRDNLTSKPYVKFYTRKRTGGGVVNFEAIKLMKFAA